MTPHAVEDDERNHKRHLGRVHEERERFREGDELGVRE